MRLERHDGQAAGPIGPQRPADLDQPAMPDVHAVEVADRHDASRRQLPQAVQTLKYANAHGGKYIGDAGEQRIVVRGRLVPSGSRRQDVIPSAAKDDPFGQPSVYENRGLRAVSVSAGESYHRPGLSVILRRPEDLQARRS